MEKRSLDSMKAQSKGSWDYKYLEYVMKVLGIAGSPRRGGNTDLLLEQAMVGAKSVGAETETIVLSKLSIEPCRHCDGCLAEGQCVIDDDMQSIYPKLRQADRIILASPMFFMGITAQAKAMIDRCQALWAIKYVLHQPVAMNTITVITPAHVRVFLRSGCSFSLERVAKMTR